MNKRITLITSIDENELNKVNKLMEKMDELTCKVPYGVVAEEKRYEQDNLPYHFTIFATNKENESKVIELAENIKVDKIKLEVNEMKIMKSKKYDSWILYLGIKDNKDIKNLRNLFYSEFPDEKFKNIFYKDVSDEKYNADNFIFHMTLHIDKNHEKVQSIYNTLNNYFEPFTLEFNKLVLFNYPGSMIKEFNIMK